MTAKERIRNILILEEMQKNPKEAKRLGLIVSTKIGNSSTKHKGNTLTQRGEIR